MATQLVVILFMIVFTYKWAFMFTTIHEQTFLANLLYGILGFIVILGLHELIHRISFFICSKGEQPHFKYKKGFLLVHISKKYFNKWQFCTIMLAPMFILTGVLMFIFSIYAYSSIIIMLSIHFGYCLIDLYLVGITFTNKFEYVHSSDEGLIMYHQRPIQANNEFE
nr:DUF3267 domain-containing protein [Staphylococcus haemolyticus]